MSSQTEATEYAKYLESNKRDNGFNLYHITDPKGGGWETYDSMIVVAESAMEAREMNPESNEDFPEQIDNNWYDNKKNLIIVFIGVATPDLNKGVVITSFNAG